MKTTTHSIPFALFNVHISGTFVCGTLVYFCEVLKFLELSSFISMSVTIKIRRHSKFRAI
jgi:hypothetical protein